MIKQIIKNEIKDTIGHEPSDLEYKSAMEYLNDNISEKDFLVDISLALCDWKHDCLAQCWACGEYFLPEEMEYRHFCTEQDKLQYEEDECADMEHKIECQSRWNER